MSKAIRRAAFASGVGSLVVIAVAGPAAANDLTLNWQSPSDSRLTARGIWDDSADNLCARGTWWTARVVIRPVDGTGPTFTIDDSPNPPDQTRTCTGNLSIPEDELYRMEVKTADGSWSTKTSGTFYT